MWVSVAKPEVKNNLVSIKKKKSNYCQFFILQAHLVLTIFITFMEGFSLYNFVVLVVTDCGGPFRFVQLLQNSGKSLVCGSCCCPKVNKNNLLSLKSTSMSF